MYIKCSICKALTHLACVPSLDKNDLLNINKCKDWICLICSSYIFPFNHLECDQEFKKCITENSSNIQKLSLPEIENKILNVFELNDHCWSEAVLNADPDDQYFNSFAHITCGSR